MRRTLALATASILTLAACGASSDGDGASVVTDSVENDGSDDDGSDDEDGEDDAGEDDDSAAEPAEEPDVDEEPVVSDKPEVDLPDEIPTELVRTVLTEGDGDAAELGDVVVVDYVGVRSEDGVEFDNSYDRGQPFPVELGTNSVIQGWEEGLIGAKAGERVQLDIPAAQAYGDQARSEVIQPNTALTFVIDVREISFGVAPEDVPTDPGIPFTDERVDDTTIVELVEGDGETLELGDVASIRFVYFRADNGALLEANWGQPFQVPYTEELLPGLLEGMEDMSVGDQRAVTIPPEDGFGPEGNPQAGLPADTDIVFRIELVDIN